MKNIDECFVVLGHLMSATGELSNESKRRVLKLVECIKDKENQLVGSLSIILASLFPLIDNFEIAMNQEEAPKELEALYKLVLTFLENLNITEVPGVGEEFDPSYHEAIEHSGEGDNQIVGEVLRKGYKLEDRLIRPAMVKVQSE